MDIHAHEHVTEYSLWICLALGALHALEPGHGKTAFIAHLLTEKEHRWRPLLLALTTSLTHAVSILLISLVVHGALHGLIQTDVDTTQVWLNGVSGGFLILMGIYILFKSSKAKTESPQFQSVDAAPFQLSLHGPLCACPSHAKAKTVDEKTWRTVAIGFIVGLMPCPSALAALTAALALQNPWQIILVTLCFSLGIFTALVALGFFVAGFSAKLQGLKTFRAHPRLGNQIQFLAFVGTGVWHLMALT